MHKGDTPFFIGLGLYRPHIPLYAPKKYFDMHPLESIILPEVPENDLDDIPAGGMARVNRTTTADSHKFVMDHGGKDKWKEGVQAYLACISFADAQIGKVLDHWKRAPTRTTQSSSCLATMVGIWVRRVAGVNSRHGFIRRKCPLIICPAGSKKKALCHEPVSLLDIYPTLIDMAGLPKKGA